MLTICSTKFFFGVPEEFDQCWFKMSWHELSSVLDELVYCLRAGSSGGCHSWIVSDRLDSLFFVIVITGIVVLFRHV